MNQHIYKANQSLILWIVENHMSHLFRSAFARPVFIQARDRMFQSRAVISEHVVFFGIGKKGEGLIPLMTPACPICYTYNEQGEDVENLLTCDEICGLAMRDGELNMVIAVDREELSNGDVRYLIDATADRATPREDDDDPYDENEPYDKDGDLIDISDAYAEERDSDLTSPMDGI